MKVYIDFLLFLNFAFDFILLLGVSLVLRRNVKINKIIIGAFIGSLSTLLLFFKISNLTLFILKIVISIILVLVTFDYKNIKYTLKNLFYLYTMSIMLGGILYFLNVQFSYKQEGLVFYHHPLSINVVIIFITSPILIYIYIRQVINLKNNYSKYYEITLYLNEKKYNLTGFLDTGNKLSFNNKPIILINESTIKQKDIDYFFVPYQTAFNTGLMKCFKADKLVIKNNGVKNKLIVGIMEERIKIDGVDCILNSKLLEE